MKITIILAISAFLFATCALAQGASSVKVIQSKSGGWHMSVDGQPYFIKGVTYSPVKIGENPAELTMRNWMSYDDDHNGRNDVAYQTWVDANRNGIQDADERVVGDFALMKSLGVNTIRLYHVPSDHSSLGDIYNTNPSTQLQFDAPVNKKLLRELFARYGIRVIMGNFIGAWTIGSGANWETGTDYANPRHRANIIKSVRAMVLDNKDEPYVLMWMLGNENNVAVNSLHNAKAKPKEYVTLIGELVRMVHELDPNHPVAIGEGDGGYNEVTLKLYKELAPEIDIVAYNSYRSRHGFGSLWNEVRTIFDRPMLISEFGTPAYTKNIGEDEIWQDQYIREAWQDIAKNQDTVAGQGGNSIGGVVFDWLDRWYMDGDPLSHDAGSKPWNTPDQVAHDEWRGIMSYGDGKDSLMRQERKICAYLRSVWTEE